jgi:hypothetical protein
MRAKRLLAVACTSALLAGAVSAPALAVNDPIVPGDECAPPNAEAVGHPAFFNQQDNPQGANPPFSSDNPGESTGARGSANSEATAHCQNA